MLGQAYVELAGLTHDSQRSFEHREFGIGLFKESS